MQLTRVAPAKNDHRGARYGRLCCAFLVLSGNSDLRAGPNPNSADLKPRTAEPIHDAGTDTVCREFEQTVLAQRARGRAVDAIIEDAVERRGRACGEIIFVALAAAASESGRLRDVERYAERSIELLEIDHSPNHPILLRPLALVFGASFGLNNLAKARRTFDRLRRIHADNPADSALIHTMAAKLLDREGNMPGVELELRAALAGQEAAGRCNTADGAWAFHQLGRLYLTQGRYEEARTVVSRALASIAAAPDAAPQDHVEMIHTEAILDLLQGRWKESERKFARALAMADAEATLDPAVMRRLVVNYAANLRKLGRGRDARTIEKRLTALPPDPAQGVVDITQLAREGKSVR